MAARRGDTVLILTGKDRGKQGLVERVFPADHQVVVTGINVAKKHVKPNRQYPAGGIIEVAMPLDISNVKVLESEAASRGQSSRGQAPKGAKGPVPIASATSDKGNK